MGTLASAWLIARRRLAANRGLVLALALGVLVASTLLASTPIYARAMADLGLSFTVQQGQQVTPYTLVETQTAGLALSTAPARQVQAEVAARVQQRLGWFSRATAHYIRMPALELGRPGQPVPADLLTRPELIVQSLDGYEQHVRVISGAMPQDTREAGAGTEFQLAVSASGADAAGIHTGDHLLIGDTFDDCERHPPSPSTPPDPPCTPHITVTRAVPAVVTAIIAPANPNDPFWTGSSGQFFVPPGSVAGTGPEIMAFLPQPTMLGAFAARFATYQPQQQWITYSNAAKLNRDNFKRAQSELQALLDDTGRLGFIGYSTLPAALQQFDQELSYNQTPLLLLILQITGVALFYVVIVAALAVEQQEIEIGLLRGRGASLGQIVAVYAMEGLIVAVPCVILGPFLAALLVHLLGATPVFHSITHGALIGVTLPPLAFALAGLGAILSLIALVAPALVVSGFRGVSLRRRVGRPERSFVQSYYLDLGLLVVAGMLLWEIGQRGSVYTPGTSGGLSSDPLLLAAPALLTVAAALLVLRTYPWLLRLAGRLFAAGTGVTIVLGIWQMTRNPAQYTRLGLLLMMGVAVGAFAATYSDTANRSYQDQAHYAAGADLRGSVAAGGATLNFAQLDAGMAAVPGVSQASSVARLDASAGGLGPSRAPVTVLAVDPPAAASLLWSRPGLSRDTVPELMHDLGTPPQEIGLPLPGTPTSISLWVNPAQPAENMTVWARIRDASGNYSLNQMGKLDFAGWRQLSAPLPAPDSTLSYPITLAAVVLTEPANASVLKRTPIYFDGVAAGQADGSTAVVEDFEGLSRWDVAPTATLNGDQIALTTDQHHDGTHALQFTPQQGDSTGVRGFFYSDPTVPLPAVISRTFSQQAGVAVGAVTSVAIDNRLVPIRVTAVADLFPTLDPNESPFVLVNRTDLREWLNTLTDSTAGAPTEAWLQLSDGADRTAVEQALAQRPLGLGTFIDVRFELQQIGADPLVGAAGSGILFVAFVSLLVLVAGAYLISIYGSLRRRRVEFAVMRALGLGRARVIALLAFEYSLVTLLGAAAGVLLGVLVSRLMLSFLDTTATGAKVLPPFVLQTNWPALATALAGLALLIAACIGAGVRLFTNEPAAAVLRVSE